VNEELLLDAALKNLTASEKNAFSYTRNALCPSVARA
jgi:hypothetical protein